MSHVKASAQRETQERKATHSKHKRQLTMCYNNIREVIPEKYGLKAPSTSPSQPDIVKDCSKSSIGRWRILSRAKDYIQHLESAVELYAQSTQHQSGVVCLDTSSKCSTGQTEIIKQVRQSFLKDFTPDKPVAEYTFDCIEAIVDANAPEPDTTQKQEMTSAAGRCQCVRLEKNEMNSRQLSNNSLNSVLFVPINVKPAVNGEPMYVSTCNSKF